MTHQPRFVASPSAHAPNPPSLASMAAARPGRIVHPTDRLLDQVSRDQIAQLTREHRVAQARRFG